MDDWRTIPGFPDYEINRLLHVRRKGERFVPFETEFRIGVGETSVALEKDNNGIRYIRPLTELFFAAFPNKEGDNG